MLLFSQDNCHIVAEKQAHILKSALREMSKCGTPIFKNDGKIGLKAKISNVPQQPPLPRDIQARISLTLLCPLLESQAKKDPILRVTTVGLLRELLATLPPQCLPKDEAFGRLDELLVSWLDDDTQVGRFCSYYRGIFT